MGEMALYATFELLMQTGESHSFASELTEISIPHFSTMMVIPMEGIASMRVWLKAFLAFVAVSGGVHAQDISSDHAAATFHDGVDWSQVPPVRVFPRTGFFAVAPTGPGYYS